MPGVRWIVFDVYGTLLTSSAGEIGTAGSHESSAEACEKIARRFGNREIPGTALAQTLVERIGFEHRRGRSAAIPHPEVDIREIWRYVIDTMLASPPAGPGGPQTPPAGVDPEELALEHELAVNPV